MTDDISNDSTTDATGVLKRDGLGRVKSDAGQREGVLDEYERSGLSGPKFAAVAGVKYATLVSWVHKRRRARATAPAAGVAALVRSPVGWVEAVAQEPTKLEGSQALRVHLPGGASLEINHQGQAMLAAALLRALHPSAAC